MDNHNILSESEEMYLITIARLIEEGQESPVPISQVASQMNIQPVSVNQMMHQLEKCGLVEYTPYKGVELTAEGLIYANQVLRRRRLWECFLVERLGIPLPEADSLACRLEHAIPPSAAESLAEFLGQPTVSPQGKAIPQFGSDSELLRGIALSTLPVGASAIVIRLETNPQEREFLIASGLSPGNSVHILGSVLNGSTLLQPGGYPPLQLNRRLLASIWVKPDLTS